MPTDKVIAYTVVISTQFNGFPNCYDIIYVDDYMALRFDRDVQQE